MLPRSSLDPPNFSKAIEANGALAECSLVAGRPHNVRATGDEWSVPGINAGGLGVQVWQKQGLGGFLDADILEPELEVGPMSLPENGFEQSGGLGNLLCCY